MRQRGNWLLCTLLIGNTIANCARPALPHLQFLRHMHELSDGLCYAAAFLSILLAGYTSGVLGLVLSTVLIVLFAEIVPQVRLAPPCCHLLLPVFLLNDLCKSGSNMVCAAGNQLSPWAAARRKDGVADSRLHGRPGPSGLAARLHPGQGRRPERPPRAL